MDVHDEIRLLVECRYTTTAADVPAGDTIACLTGPLPPPPPPEPALSLLIGRDFGTRFQQNMNVFKVLDSTVPSSVESRIIAFLGCLSAQQSFILRVMSVIGTHGVEAELLEVRRGRSARTLWRSVRTCFHPYFVFLFTSRSTVQRIAQITVLSSSWARTTLATSL